MSVDAELARFEYLGGAKYRPDQPRAPRGSDRGGEWVADPNGGRAPAFVDAGGMLHPDPHNHIHPLSSRAPLDARIIKRIILDRRRIHEGEEPEWFRPWHETLNGALEHMGLIRSWLGGSDRGVRKLESWFAEPIVSAEDLNAFERYFPETRPRTKATDDEDDHYYGAWIGGPRAAGGHPAPRRSSAAGDELASCKTIGDLQKYAERRYGYADFTGLRDGDFKDLQLALGEVDRILREYPELISDEPRGFSTGAPWRFTGIGTTKSPDCPRNVRELMGDAWAGTKGLSQHNGARIWLNVEEPDIFQGGTGVLGDIGFTLEKTPQDAMIHEMGHVVHITRPHALEKVNDAWWEVYNRDPVRKPGGGYTYPRYKPVRQSGRDLGLYSMGSAEERYATLFFANNGPGALDRLPSDAARARVRKVRELANARGNKEKIL